MAIETYS